MTDNLETVRVAVRIKPLTEESENEVVVEANQNIVLVNKERPYAFDKVFGGNAGQEEVYKELVQPQVLKLIDGYNCASLGISSCHLHFFLHPSKSRFFMCCFCYSLRSNRRWKNVLNGTARAN